MAETVEGGVAEPGRLDTREPRRKGAVLVERLATVFCAALLVRHAPGVSDRPALEDITSCCAATSGHGLATSQT